MNGDMDTTIVIRSMFLKDNKAYIRAGAGIVYDSIPKNEFLETEKKAESFYREKADEVDDDNNKRILKKIADEEHNHWVAIENVIQFLEKPNRWLENAEWSDLETF